MEAGLHRVLWFFCGHAVSVGDVEGIAEAEVKLRVKHAVLSKAKELRSMARVIEAFENVERIPDARRERIPESVRLFVWQRDGSKCVRCGGAEKLEFDHIIPVVKGGASTERNGQLLCESCNRAKGANI
jgi:5-methylcytosine-specific restriction endonuclease McrA